MLNQYEEDFNQGEAKIKTINDYIKISNFLMKEGYDDGKNINIIFKKGDDPRTDQSDDNEHENSQKMLREPDDGDIYDIPDFDPERDLRKNPMVRED